MTCGRLIVGLGNPGRDYERTRHNVGFLVVRHLAKECQIRLDKDATLPGWTGRGQLGTTRLLLLLPATYMNHSGLAVKKVVTKELLSRDDVLIVTDDLALTAGDLRIRPRGSAGGHNGLASVIEQLATDDFARLRCGIGQPPQGEDMSQFVLSEFSAQEELILEQLLARASDCCRVWVSEGVEKAMSQFNRRKMKDD